MALKKPECGFPDLNSEAALGFFVSDALIIGVDEVGRGCLAGPVVAGAAALDSKVLRALGFDLQGRRPESEASRDLSHPVFLIRDSKLIPEKDRAPLAQLIDRKKGSSHSAVLAHSVAEASVEEIASLNILHASMLAMERAVAGVETILGRAADAILVDGNRVPKGLIGRGHAIVKGDQKSLTIATASIFAKVYRDALMDDLESRFPGYGLSKHKGYPTPLHKEQIRVLGATPIHREGFRGVR